MILTDELCDKLCHDTHEKSKELGIDISFAICDKHGLPKVYRRFGAALVLPLFLEKHILLQLHKIKQVILQSVR